ncbi:MAG: hypothetical protein NXI31_22840 [bacterium]|nr:hypothetical protein [bacterium]
MRETSRRWLMRLCWAGALITGAMLVGLRIGRPVYYTDGQREIASQEVSASGMLVWQTPEVEVELPGPVVGRVAVLPDGRLLYGRRSGAAGADGTTDLVVFDPERPRVPPEPAYGLNSADNELGPACTPAGEVFFASDRVTESSAGGYDLYRATWTPRGFTTPTPVVLCNTAKDETDPAPSAASDAFVFVRIDPSVRDGDNGTLMRCDLALDREPARLFPAPATRHRIVDRDPAFTHDGGALWFVRKHLGGEIGIWRVSVLGDQVDAPVAIGGEWGVRRLRAPTPGPDGVTLGLLQPRLAGGADAVAAEAGDLWYVAAAREIYPWWQGQRWLEWLLLGLFLTFLLVLLLLHYGRRWSALDLLAQCLLLSLLLHVLLFLWLMGVEITGALMAGNEDGGSLEVTVVNTSTSDASSSAAGGSASVAAMVRFEPTKRSFDVQSPGATAERVATAEIAAPDSNYESNATARDETVDVAQVQSELLDRQEIAPTRTGADAAMATAAAALPEVAGSDLAAAAAAESSLASGAPQRVVVNAPGGTVGRATPRRDHATDGAAGQTAAPSARELSVSRPTVAAALPAGAASRRAAADEGIAVPDAKADELTGPTSATARAATSAERSAQAAPEREVVAATEAPAGLVLRGGSSAELAPRSSLSAPAPAARPTRSNTGSPALRDVRAAANPAVAKGVDAPRRVIERVTGRITGPSTTARPLAARAPSAGNGSALQVAMPQPRSDLGRATRRSVAPSASSPRPQLRDRPAARVAAAMPLRDGAEPSRSARGPRQPGKDRPLAAPQLAQADLRPRASVLDRPQRSPLRGVFGRAIQPLEMPGSLVERPAPRLEVANASQPTVAEPTAYSNRFGPAKAKALERFGGTAATERAVVDGLRYLARIQNDDGSWGQTGRWDDKYGRVYVGKSALCVLAFLGAGHTPSSDTEHSEVVERALSHLLALQDEDTGAFGPSSCYGHGIATYALAECYGMTKEPALLRPLESALTWILENQGPRRDRRNRGGWGYFSPGLRREDSYARMSVSSWMIMALESARMSGVELPEEVLPRAREYVVNSFDGINGWFRYNHKPRRLRSGWPTLPASTPAGAFCLMLLGEDSDHRMVRTAVDYTVTRRPQEYRRYSDDDFVLGGQGNVYFWYYGTLCCFLAGGEAWEQWNSRLSTLLPASQSPDGSFAPIDVYAIDAGDNRRDRSYTTAMCVLSLEVYYRYFTPLLLGR